MYTCLAVSISDTEKAKRSWELQKDPVTIKVDV
jgi:hypothetical protein